MSADERAERKRKRRGAWDVDAEGKSVQPHQPLAANVPGAMMLPNQAAQMSAMAAQQQAMVTAMLSQQAALTRRARRLHVGNLPPDITAEALKELFNSVMQAANLALDTSPCVNEVSMAGENKYSFLEFRSVQETTNALALDGMQLLGRPLRVARPNDYQPAPAEVANVMIPPSISSTVTSSNPPPVRASKHARLKLDCATRATPALTPFPCSCQLPGRRWGR